MHTRPEVVMGSRREAAVTPRVCNIFLIIQRLGVNYSAYTTVATPQDIDQMIYFKASVRFFYLNHFFWDSSNATLAANSKTE